MSLMCDLEGRISILKILCSGSEIALCNIYGPNRENAVFFTDLGVQIQRRNVGATVLGGGGDLNTVLSPLEDRRAVQGAVVNG